MKTYKTGDQININFNFKDEISSDIKVKIIIRREDNGDFWEYDEGDGNLTKISNKLYNLFISPEECLEFETGTFNLEVALYKTDKSFVNVGMSTVDFNIVYSTAGKEILK